MIDGLKCYITLKKVIQIIHIITILDLVMDINQILSGTSPQRTHKNAPRGFLCFVMNSDTCLIKTCTFVVIGECSFSLQAAKFVTFSWYNASMVKPGA